MSQQKAAPDPTEIAGRYQVIQKLGAGAFGTVYKAKDKILGRMLAIKTIRLEGLAASGASLDELLDRFKREAQVSAQLKHPNIVTIYDIGDADGLSYLAMEFIDGVGLEKVISGSGRLPIDRAAMIGAQVAEALDFAHKHNVVHRDIKPANIMIETGDRVKVTDFGIAKVTDSGDHLTMTGSLLGTPSYMSPEQARGTNLDGRSDLFSAGCVLYEMITGKKAFRGDSITGLIFKIITEEPTPLEQELPDIPEEMTRIIKKALAKAPETRYQSGHDLAQDLLGLTRGESTPTMRQSEVATTVIPAQPGAPTVSSGPTALKASVPTAIRPQPVPAVHTPPPHQRTQVAQPVVAPAAAPAPRPAPAKKSRAGLILGLLAAGLLLVLAVGALGVYFLFMRDQPTDGTTTVDTSMPTDEASPATSTPDTEPAASTPPIDDATDTETPITYPPVTAPPVTAPPATMGSKPTTGPRPPVAPPQDAGGSLEFLDSEPQILEGRRIGERVAGTYRKDGGSTFGASGPLRARDRFPRDVSGLERRAVFVLLNLTNLQAAHHQRTGRYGTFAETIPGRAVSPRSFERHGYRYDLTLESDGFTITANPLNMGSRALLVDDTGFVRYPD